MEVGRRLKEGMYVYLQLIHTVVQQKLAQHCKAIILQLKKKKDGSQAPSVAVSHNCVHQGEGGRRKGIKSHSP